MYNHLLSKYSPEIQEEIIRLGISCWETVIKVKEITTLTDNQINQIFSKCEIMFKGEIDRAYNLSHQSGQIYGERIDNVIRGINEMKNNYSQIYGEKIDIVLRAINDLKTNEMKNNYSQIYGEKIDIVLRAISDLKTNSSSRVGEKIEDILDAIDDMDKNYKHLRDVEIKYNELTSRNKTSYQLGKYAEEAIYKIICEHTKYDVQKTNDKKFMGDIKISNNFDDLLIDVKNYSKNVPSAECEKLFRDIDYSSTTVGGILISCNSKICMRSHGDLEYSPKNKPTIFLNFSNFNNEEIGKIINVTCRFLFGMKKSPETHAIKFTKVLSQINTLGAVVKNIEKHSSEIKSDCKRMHDEISSIINEFNDTIPMEVP